MMATEVKPLKEESIKLSFKKKSFNFLRSVKEEFRKVHWTTKKELIFSTKTVLLTMLLLGLTIYGIDLGVRGILHILKGIIVR